MNETRTEIPYGGTWAYAGDNAGGHKIFTRGDGSRLIAPLGAPGHKHTRACLFALAVDDVKAGRPRSVPDHVIERARKLLSLRDETHARRYTYGYRYTLTEVARMVGVVPSTLNLRLETDDGMTITEQRRREYKNRRKSE